MNECPRTFHWTVWIIYHELLTCNLFMNLYIVVLFGTSVSENVSMSMTALLVFNSCIIQKLALLQCNSHSDCK